MLKINLKISSQQLHSCPSVPQACGSSAWDKGYRYGFNGKEIDKGSEGMGGGGSTYDYGFRIYNPSLGKFLSVDPLTASYPWYTPYQFAGNMPIWAVDLDGLEELKTNDGPIKVITHPSSSDEFKNKVTLALTKLNASTVFSKNLKNLNKFLNAVYVYEREINPNDPNSDKSASNVYENQFGIILIPKTYDGSKLVLSLAYEVQNVVNDRKYKEINANVGNLTKESFVDQYFLTEAEAQISLMDVAIELGLENDSEQKNAIEQYKKLKADPNFDLNKYKSDLAAQLENDNPTVKKAYENLYDTIKPKEEKKNESDTTNN